jgi:adenylate cyclase
VQERQIIQTKPPPIQENAESTEGVSCKNVRSGYHARMLKLGNRRYLFLVLIFLAVWLIDQGWLNVFDPLRARFSDALLARHALQSEPDRDIVIVDIDERSLAEMSASVGRWPWPRSIHAELVEGIERQRPRAVVFDILISDPDHARPEGDEYFAEVIAATSNTYFPMLKLEGGEPGEGIPLSSFGQMLGISAGPQADPEAQAHLVLPLPSMLGTGRLGTHNAVADKDGVVRTYPLYLEEAGWHLPSLPARVASGLGFAEQPGNSIILNWHGTALSYPRVSYFDVYQDFQRREPTRPADEFADKIVIIGATANGLHDIRATPVDGLYPGVEILATAIDNLKNANPMCAAPQWTAVVLGVLLLAALYLGFACYRHVLRIGVVLGVVTVALLSAAYFALRWNYMVTVLPALIFAWVYYITGALMEYLRERKARERAVQTFGRFLDPRVVKSLVDRGETTQTLSGKSRDISVLFSDIRGFTTLSEASTPEQVVELLNAYFTLQEGAIFSQEGTLDKYIGDAIMAFWGAPEHQPDHAVRAVAAALEMSRRLEEFRTHAGPLGKEIEIGIGVHSGPAVVGFIGSEKRQDYTAIGDTVNLASRIEGETKGICRVLVSEDTKARCEQNGSPYEFIDRGSFQVKGRVQPVRLFEPREKT